MKLDKPRRPTELIHQIAQLERVFEDVEASQGPIAIDAERASGFKYSQRAYLIQLAAPGESIWLLDPIALTAEDADWSLQLQSKLSGKPWILHAATQDLPCLSELGLTPSSLIDTELAARLAGHERFGLGSLATNLLDLELAKEHSASDWSLRPLGIDLLDYAALDVDVLHELSEVLAGHLHEAGKQTWAEQEFSHLLTFQPKPQAEEPWRAIVASAKLKDLDQIRIVASLWLARDQIARSADIAPGRLIPDRSIAAAAKQIPQSKRDLALNREFQGRASRGRIDEWWEAIASSRTLEINQVARDSDVMPNHRSWERRFPDAHARYQAIRPLIIEQAAELKLPPENLISPEVIRRVCWQPSEDLQLQLVHLGARRWQIDLVSPVITEALSSLNQ